MRKLTPRQERFVQEYLVDLNATQAAIRAGYSPKNADVSGPRLLGNVGVAAEIRRKQLERSEDTQITQKFVLEGLIANLELGRSLDNPGAVNRTLELLGKHIDMFKDRVEHSGKIGLGSILDELDGRTGDSDSDQGQIEQSPLAH